LVYELDLDNFSSRGNHHQSSNRVDSPKHKLLLELCRTQPDLRRRLSVAKRQFNGINGSLCVFMPLYALDEQVGVILLAAASKKCLWRPGNWLFSQLRRNRHPVVGRKRPRCVLLRASIKTE